MSSGANSAGEKKPTCFIAMPISTRPSEVDTYGDEVHWPHVMESLFVKAIEAAGYEPIRPAARGADLIHGEIIRNLIEADLVLCDLSSHNPNVFFELGVRTSLNLPIALVRDEHTALPFDTSGINTEVYSSLLRGWDIEAEQAKLAKHITDSAASCAGENPLWRQFGLTIRAQEPDAKESPLEAKVDLIADRMMLLQHSLDADRAERERVLPVRNESLDRQQLYVKTLTKFPLNDPNRTPPSALFAGAVSRFAEQNDLSVDVIPVGVFEVVVFLHDSWSASQASRLVELAAKYEVKAEWIADAADGKENHDSHRKPSDPPSA